MLGFFLYFIYLSNLPTSHNTSVVTYADDTAILTTHRQTSTSSE